jgi:hypothetical protein
LVTPEFAVPGVAAFGSKMCTLPQPMPTFGFEKSVMRACEATPMTAPRSAFERQSARPM